MMVLFCAMVISFCGFALLTWLKVAKMRTNLSHESIYRKCIEFNFLPCTNLGTCKTIAKGLYTHKKILISEIKF